MSRNLVAFLLLFSSAICTAQIEDSLTLGFTEYMAMVKKYHPLVKQANLLLDEGEIKLLNKETLKTKEN